ncbi:MAG: ABC transporter ATP-binding protein [Candidatus Asgardarchaeia archaeon]
MSTEKEKIIDIKNMSFKYSDSKKYALTNINLAVNKGEFITIMGPTGAGKSTLCLTLNGSIPHMIKGTLKGDVIVDGINTKSVLMQKLASKVGVVFQNPNLQLFCLDVESELAFGPENLAVDPKEIHRRIQEISKILRLEDLLKRPPSGLSGGQKQAVAIGAVLTMQPKVLVLDEPTSNLDPLGTKQVFEILKNLRKEKDITVIMVSHKSEEIAEFSDRIVVLHEGSVLFDSSPDRIFGNEKIINEAFIRPPQVSEVVYTLMKKGYHFDKVPVTLDEAVELFKDYLKKHNVKNDNDTNKHKLVKENNNVSKRAKNEVNRNHEPIIKVRNLWHIYRGNVTAIKNISLDIYPGEFISIIGQNGAGKTTLVKHFNGILKPTKGFVLVKGIDTRTMKLSELSRYVGYIYQNPDDQLFADSVEEEVAFGPKNLGWPEEKVKETVEEVLKRLNLYHLKDEHPLSLSLGDRHRVAVAAVLSMKPDVVILDEPTTGQDYRGSREIVNLVKELIKEGKTVIMITHDMYLVAEYSQRVIVLSQGEILLDGTPKEVFSKPDILAQSYLSPPQIALLSQRLSEFGFPQDIISIKEFCDVFEKIVEGGSN